MEANRRQWDERAPLHVMSEFYDLEGFRAGRSTLRAVEVEEVGDVTGRELLHLQCHFGLDTLSWARRGARVTGLDFSESAVEAARALADAEGIDAEFVVRQRVRRGRGPVGAHLRRGLHGDRGAVLAARHRPVGGDRRRAASSRVGRSTSSSTTRSSARSAWATASPTSASSTRTTATRSTPCDGTVPARTRCRTRRPSTTSSYEWNHSLGAIIVGPDRARPRARVPARAPVHAVAAVAVPGRGGARDLAAARRVRGATPADVLAARDPPAGLTPSPEGVQ